MSLYEETIKDIEEKRARKQQKLFNGVPFSLPRYRKYFDTFEKGTYMGIVANSGVGKSRFLRHLIYHIVDFAIANRYMVKILYFAMEDEKKQINKRIIAHYLYVKYGVSLSQQYLNSIDEPLPDKYLQLIKNDEPFWKLFESIVWIINDANTPNEILRICNNIHEKYGKTHHLFACLDNLANVVADPSDENEWSAIRRLSRNICRLHLCKTLGYTVIALVQADIDTEKGTFKNVGSKGLINIEPNSASLGGTKVIIRDFYILLGLFSPHKYEIEQYPYSGAYNVKVLRNKLLSLLCLKNNNGECAPRLCLNFDGKNEVITELPQVEDKEALEKLYNAVMKEELEKKSKSPSFWTD